MTIPNFSVIAASPAALPAAALAAAALGTVAFGSLPRLISARCPGMQSLCRWVLIATLLAGALAGSSCALLAVVGTSELGKAIALGCAAGLLAQGAGWLLFLVWLPARRTAHSTDEQALLRSLTAITQLAARAAIAQ